MKGFINFIREQGVVGLAVGFVLGGAVSGLVDSIVRNIFDPLLGALMNDTGLSDRALTVGDAQLRWGALVATLVNFLTVVLVVYLLVKWLRVERLDRKPEAVEKAQSSRRGRPASRKR